MKAQRRPCGKADVQFDVKYCGVCFSDVGVAANWKPLLKPAVYPIVPGHELSGIVTGVGSDVTKFKVGDHIGVGCWVDSCLSCNECKAGREQWCKKEGTLTYNSDKNPHGRASFACCKIGDKPVKATLGGYSTVMVVHEHFGIKIPESYPLEAAGPVMCSGVTVYEPMKEHKLTKGSKLGVIGLGGLGLTAIKIGKALGAEVSAISRGIKKEPIARENGATGFVSSTDAAQMTAAANSFDLIIDTIPMSHDPAPYHALLKPIGKYVFLGIHDQFFGTMIATMTGCGSGNYRISNTGGLSNTQEIIDLCAKENVIPLTRKIGVSEINMAYESLAGGNDDAIRYVIDMSTLTDQAFQTCSAPPPALGAGEKPPSMARGLCFCCKISPCKWFGLVLVAGAAILCLKMLGVNVV
jgi:D-arabinose 1-dehydrogenase-like Zn-dependent alcohol dehydrogenase